MIVRNREEEEMIDLQVKAQKSVKIRTKFIDLMIKIKLIVEEKAIMILK